jgi:hypothetical protein
MAAPKLPAVTRFRGLNNVMDPLSMGLEWLVQADNIDITDAGKPVARSGYSRALAGAFTGAYATIDHSRMYVVDNGVLKAMAGNSTAVTLATLESDALMHWTEINGQVFYNNGVDSGIIGPDNTVLPWSWTVPGAPTLEAVTGTLDAGLYRVACTFTLADGRMTGASEPVEIVLADGEALQISGIHQADNCTTNVFIAPANSSVFGLAAVNAPEALTWNASANDLGRELQTAGLSPLPPGCDVIQEWKGRLYAAEWLASADQTVLWPSLPLGFHLFDLAGGEAFMVHGKVLMLAPHDLGLVIGTERAIHALTPEGQLVDLAPYGVKSVLFWTCRGVCRALPFSNLTEANVSVAPGLRAGGAIVRAGGQKRFLVAIQQGGTAFNQR